MLTSAPPQTRWLGVVLGRETLQRVARALAPQGIAVAPLKGVLLAHTVYADPIDRPSIDVDVLVPEARFDDALAVLRGVGFTTIAGASVRSDAERCLRHPEHPVVLDVHRMLFAPHRYTLSTAAVLARARRDTELFDAPVLLLDPMDLYAHLVGHFANDHVDARDSIHVEDLVAVARVHALDPRDTAHRLVASGLARAARYTLNVVVAARHDAFAADVLRALPGDPMGTALARLARVVVERSPPRSSLGTPLAYALDHSLVAATRAALHALVRTWLPSRP